MKEVSKNINSIRDSANRIWNSIKSIVKKFFLGIGFAMTLPLSVIAMLVTACAFGATLMALSILAAGKYISNMVDNKTNQCEAT